MQQGLFDSVQGSGFQSKSRNQRISYQSLNLSSDTSSEADSSPEPSNLTTEGSKVISTEILKDLIDDVILGLSFEVHREMKLNILFLDEAPLDDDKHEIVNEPGLDIFGQAQRKKQAECECPVCYTSMATCRFTRHLQNCIGKGRNSQRLATLKIEQTRKRESDIEDGDSDSDWNSSSERKPRRKRDKNSRRANRLKAKNGDSAQVFDTGTLLSYYKNIPIEERKVYLMQMCGVISEHSKKICTNSIRCSSHTEEQKQFLRSSVLESNYITNTSDEVQVDVDTVEEETNTLRLWEASSFDDISIVEPGTTSNGSKKDERKSSRSGITSQQSMSPSSYGTGPVPKKKKKVAAWME